MAGAMFRRWLTWVSIINCEQNRWPLLGLLPDDKLRVFVVVLGALYLQEEKYVREYHHLQQQAAALQ